MQEIITKAKFDTLDRDFLYELFLNFQGRIKKLSEANANLTETNEKLTEQIALMNTRRFVRKSEKDLTDPNQLTLFDKVLNEAESNFAPLVSEPEADTIIVPEHKRRKRKGKREEDLSSYPVKVVTHELPEEELQELFPNGYFKLPDEIYKKLEMIPATFEVLEHHISVYKSKSDGKIVKADHPAEMINNSVATPSLVSAIMNGKYTNAVPLYRMEQEFERNDICISRQLMSNWVIITAERYLSLIYDRIKEEIQKSKVIHADETPVTVVKDGRIGEHKSFMWVYRTGTWDKEEQAVLYEYQKTRKSDAPREFLKNFKGKLVCDGYQVYHSLEDRVDGFTVCGCWAHARRHFAEVVKSLGEKKSASCAAYDALIQIDNIYHVDNRFRKLPPTERKKKRRQFVKPLVDNYFEWCRAKQGEGAVLMSAGTAKGISYSLNQEKYLRVFLDDPLVPLDNNAAEATIRPFCVGKKNWKIIDTEHGAEASAIIYSIVETAKANNLNITQYLKHLLTEIPKHMKETSPEFLDELLPWSSALPEICRKAKPKNETK